MKDYIVGYVDRLSRLMAKLNEHVEVILVI